jgi:acetolactate synthase-1/2/3 large subunit
MHKRDYIVADALLDTLKAHGVKTIFGYPGGAILPFYDALPFHKDIEHVLVRHEQGAAFAAEGWARSTGTIGVCCATSGPGATNLITGIADAMMDSIPILCITGQVPLEMIGKDMFQETDVTGVTLSITKHNYLVENPKDIVPITTEAIAIALSGRKGPVLIDVPKNIMAAQHPEKFEIKPANVSSKDAFAAAYEGLSDDLAQKVIDALFKAKRPILLLGQGVKHAGASNLAERFIEITNIPAVTTILAKGIIKDNNPHYLGMLGMHGFYHSNLCMHNADLILNVGSRFDDRIVGRYDVFGKNAVIIHVDIDRSELNKVVETQIPIHCDAKLFLEKMLAHPGIKKLHIPDWQKKINEWQCEKPYQKTTKHFSMRNCLAAIMDEVKKDPERFIIVADVGQHQMWAALSCSAHSPHHFLTSGGAGSMGFALPAAMGAAFAHPDKTILCITGDGGVQMNIQELGAIKAYNRNVKVCILNNFYLGMVRQWQELFYDNNYSHVAFSNPDYTLLAQAYGIQGDMINGKNCQNMPALLSKILNKPGPHVVEFHVEKEDNVYPMVPGGKHLGETITE